jgi:hypothetical protein
MKPCTSPLNFSKRIRRSCPVDHAEALHGAGARLRRGQGAWQRDPGAGSTAREAAARAFAFPHTRFHCKWPRKTVRGTRESLAEVSSKKLSLNSCRRCESVTQGRSRKAHHRCATHAREANGAQLLRSASSGAIGFSAIALLLNLESSVSNKLEQSQED